MSLYETIFTRRSVRQYDNTPLREAELADIQAALDAMLQMPGQSARFVIVSAAGIKSVNAPYAILAYCENTDAALCNVGFCLQTMDLYLQNKGYGSLWMGMAKPAEPEPDFQILLAFGKTTVPARKGELDFTRRPVSEISNKDNAIARAARLAPSAVNFQPWRLDFAPGRVRLTRVPRGMLKMFIAKLQKIDLGICLKHTVLALEHKVKNVNSITPDGGGKGFAVIVEYESLNGVSLD
jgi:nitroreductase